ncbi:unnamed protein product [Bursaphelenchus xylophilus]|uniref:(pine wood nematode) hypothetical protein n=1 Tax=Bursaphelenchus xylophilus TaxID=6326 RepID=A0A1I7RK86_BURXY|nr:unnamed protein product [Bursaphelenchus xylophilus]CAG9131420.1 unnamed protein product [Bursaphelenchus xylophilus]
MVSGRLTLIALAFLVVPGQSQSLLSLLPPQLQSLLPPSAIPPLAGLTPRDVQVAQAMSAQFNQFTSIPQLLNTLAINSPNLAALVNQGIAKAQQQLALTKAMLLPPAQQFMSNLGLIGQNAALQASNLLQAQTPPTQANLASTFPTISSLLQAPLTQQSLPLLMPS